MIIFAVLMLVTAFVFIIYQIRQKTSLEIRTKADAEALLAQMQAQGKSIEEIRLEFERRGATVNITHKNQLSHSPWDSVAVKSLTNNKISYTTNTRDLTCSCPDFSDRRATFNATDPRRLCKHLIIAITESDIIPNSLQQYRPKLIALADVGVGYPLFGKNEQTDIDGMKYDITYPDDIEATPWVNIYNNAGEKYGYNPNEYRWSYGQQPPSASQLRQLIHEKVGKPLPEIASPESIKLVKHNLKHLEIELNAHTIEIDYSPKAKWWTYYINGVKRGSVNIETGASKGYEPTEERDRISFFEYGFLQPAIKQWLLKEAQNIINKSC